MKISEEPLCHIKSSECEMYAIMTQRAFLDVLNILANKSVEAQGDADDLAEFLKKKNQKLQEKLGETSYEPRPGASEEIPAYQSL